jgi:hypothetical protein
LGLKLSNKQILWERGERSSLAGEDEAIKIINGKLGISSQQGSGSKIRLPPSQQHQVLVCL